MQLESVKTLLGEVLSLGTTTNTLTRDTALIGSIPEFDSMAVVQVLAALEERYGFTIDDDEISAETFATVGTLADFVEQKLAA
jgi:acyl carrier protein